MIRESYGFAIFLDQLSVGPLGKQHLGQPCDCQGIQDPEHHGRN